MTCNVLFRQKVNPRQAGKIIHHGILFTISMFLRRKNQLAKKGLKFSLNYYYKDMFCLSAYLVVLPVSTGLRHGQ
jgi:hypothetical protein